MIFFAGVAVGLLAGIILTLYVASVVPRILGKIFQASPER